MQSHLFVCAPPSGIPASGDNPPSVCNNNEDPKYAWETNDHVEKCYRPIMAMKMRIQLGSVASSLYRQGGSSD